jgi:serine/threonine protein kinase
MKYQLHSAYPHLKPLIESIEMHFQDSSQVLHAERNEIRIVTFAGADYVIKSFKIPNIINRFAYRYLRSSKARRSYDYSLKLGADICPQAMAYIEQFQYSLLARSYYISDYFNYDFTIRPLLIDANFANRQQILQQFAEFTYSLHQANVLHRDYSPGNILIKKQRDNYEFKIIDVNRMQFRALNLEDRLTNFARLMVDDATMEILLKRYAQLINKPQNEILNVAIQYRDQFVQRREFKNKLRGR